MVGRILSDLAEIGFDAEWHTSASGIGAPYRRERVWIIAYPSEQDYKAQKPETIAAKGRNAATNSLPDAVEYRGERGRLNPAWVEWLLATP